LFNNNNTGGDKCNYMFKRYGTGPKKGKIYLMRMVT
jgi:hypothetical protein